MKLDVLISNAEVYDGVHADAQKVNVGIKNDRIAYVGTDAGSNMAEQHMDASGLMLTPGFIDSHASEGFSYLRDNAADHKLYQGVTTELFGNCGYSPAPIMGRNRTDFESHGEKIGFEPDWTSYQEYTDKVSRKGLPINIASLTGHNTLRTGVAGNDADIDKTQQRVMQDALSQSVDEGAFGLSTGLIYPPGCYANTDEIIELAKVVQQYGGVYASHIRNERDYLTDAVEEALQITKATGVRTLISHLKSAERRNWGRVAEVIKRLENFKQETQQEVAVDVYPYTAVSTRLRAFLPPEILIGGHHDLPEKLANTETYQQCLVHFKNRDTDFTGMKIIGGEANGTDDLESIAQIAQRLSLQADHCALQLLSENPDHWVVYECLSEADMHTAIMWQDSMICSDSWSYPVNAETDIGDPHPRTYGAFSRFLSEYVFTDNSDMPIGEAIRKITSRPAQYLNFQQRGEIRENYRADLVLMNPDSFADKANYASPRQFAEGVEHLWVNGQQVIHQGNIINRQAGDVLRYVKA